MYLNEEQLRKLSTKRLLSYKRKYFPHSGKGDCDTCISICLYYNDYNKCCDFSDEYVKTYPEDFGKPSIVERVLNILKLKQDDPRRRFKQS